jgi:hypothetical protein
MKTNNNNRINFIAAKALPALNTHISFVNKYSIKNYSSFSNNNPNENIELNNNISSDQNINNNPDLNQNLNDFNTKMENCTLPPLPKELREESLKIFTDTLKKYKEEESLPQEEASDTITSSHNILHPTIGFHENEEIKIEKLKNIMPVETIQTYVKDINNADSMLNNPNLLSLFHQRFEECKSKDPNCDSYSVLKEVLSKSEASFKKLGSKSFISFDAETFTISINKEDFKYYKEGIESVYSSIKSYNIDGIIIPAIGAGFAAKGIVKILNQEYIKSVNTTPVQNRAGLMKGHRLALFAAGTVNIIGLYLVFGGFKNASKINVSVELDSNVNSNINTDIDSNKNGFIPMFILNAFNKFPKFVKNILYSLLFGLVYIIFKTYINYNNIFYILFILFIVVFYLLIEILIQIYFISNKISLNDSKIYKYLPQRIKETIIIEEDKDRFIIIKALLKTAYLYLYCIFILLLLLIYVIYMI